DTIPPRSFVKDIKAAVAENHPIGCYRFKFNSSKWILKFNAYMTRFDQLFCRGGDQTLFVRKDIFEKLGGYKDDFKIMEEYDFIMRARKEFSFKIIPKDVIVSARKYEGRSWLQVMFANGVVFNMFRWGASQDAMVKMYRRLLKN
ncbi:MAG: glycosyl transferase, partial [Bacteroidota bacterium]